LTWQNLLGALVFIGLVLFLWNAHHVSRWSRKNMTDGTIFEGSKLAGPAWLESPWPGRALALLVVVMVGTSLVTR
jgi:hypothetical protein